MVANSRTDAPPDAGSSDVGRLVRNYLTSKGLNYSPDNVRRAIEANARDSTVLGPDPIQGLRNADAGGDPGVGQGGNVSRSVEQPPKPTSGQSIAEQNVGKIRPGETAGQTVTSAQPTPAPVAAPPTDVGAYDVPGAVATPGGGLLGPGTLGASIAAAIPLIGRYLTGNPAPATGVAPPPVAPDVPQPGSMTDVIDKGLYNMPQPLMGPPPPPGSPGGEAPLPITPQPPGQPRVTVEELPTNYRTRPPMRLRAPYVRLP